MNGIRWQWGDVEERAFCELERGLVATPVLKMSDFDRTVAVTSDASLVSVEAILEQDFGQGFQPVAFES